MQPMNTWLTVAMVRDHLRNLSKRKKQQGSEVLVEANSPPSASASLSDSPPMRSPMIRDSGYKGIARMANEIAECTPSPGDFSAPDHNLRILSGAVDDPQQAQQGRMCTTTTPSSITLGRPKGSTQQHFRDLKQRIRLATTDSAKQFSAALEGRRHGSTTCQCKHTHESSRLPMGTLQGIIAAAKAKYNLPKSVLIKEATIRSRYKRGNLDPELEQGTPSPLAHLEPYFVAVIIQLAKMRQPISSGTGLHLVNSMIEGTQSANNLERWKLKHNVQTRMSTTTTTISPSDEGCHQSAAAAAALVLLEASATDTETTSKAATAGTLVTTRKKKTWSTTVGKGYWRGFLKRNHHLIRSKRAVKFEAKQAEWCTYDNFLKMYEEVYKEMTDCGIASKLKAKAHVDKTGNIVEFKHDGYGLPTQYLMHRPDKLLFVDEVGSNTSTTKVRSIRPSTNQGGNKRLTLYYPRLHCC